MENNWIDPVQVEIPEALLSTAGGNILVANAIYRRGIQSPAAARSYLDYHQYIPAYQTDLPDLSKAADRIEIALRKGQRIGVWGDFDVDGQTATTILVSALRRLDGKVTHHIPVRGPESHGISIPFLKEFLDQGVELILTCDTGITALDAVRYASNRQVDTIITDHHTLLPELPAAVAVINPQRLPAQHALHPLCGVGCAFQLLRELFHRTGRLDELDDYLDLVAIGTIADIARLVGDNRYLVQAGLARLQSHPRPAILAIMEQAELKSAGITEEQIGFIIGPRLNAIGRLGDANPIVEFLESRDAKNARSMALRLEALNARRKHYCDQVLHSAQDQIRRNPSMLDYEALVLNHPSWPAGIVGIVASRLAEIYQKPAVLIASPPGEIAHGSARSIGNIDIISAITSNKNLLEGFGGHTGAAGLSIQSEKISEFRRSLSNTIALTVEPEKRITELLLDAYLHLRDLNMPLVESLNQLAPFGSGNPPVLLASRDLTITNATRIGKYKEHYQVTVREDNCDYRILWWQGADFNLPEGKFDLAYQVRTSSFGGEQSLQIEWVAARLLSSVEIFIPTSKPRLEIIDLRAEPFPEDIIRQHYNHPNVMVWGEVNLPHDIMFKNRLTLLNCETLVIWNSPPSIEILDRALENSLPSRVVLCAVPNPFDKMETFLLHLAGLVKFAFQKLDGKIDISHLGAATGQRDSAIELGLELLEAKGFIQFINPNKNEVQIRHYGKVNPQQADLKERRLHQVFKETAAFRAYYQITSPISLLKNYQVNLPSN